MNARLNMLWRRCAVAAALVAMSMAGTAGVARADDAPTANIDPSAKGSLIIHKYDAQQGVPGDGTEQSPAGDPLGNVKFTIWQLGKDSGGACAPIDLTGSDGWEAVPTGAAPATTDAVKAAGYCLVKAAGTTQTTDASGATTFSDLPLSLYYVQETDSSAATKNGQPVTVISEAAPFYVSVPLPHSGNWLYTVNAYPKNQTLGKPVMTINANADQDGLALGSTVEWTIAQTVPRLNDGDSYTSASLWDALPADGSLSYTSTLKMMIGSAALTEGTDYTVDPEGITWTLTSTGLGKLKAGRQLSVVFTTRVLKVTPSGEIAGPGGKPGDPGYGSEFNNVTSSGASTSYSYWGSLKVTRTDQYSKPVSGAEFKLFPQTAASCSSSIPSDGLAATGSSGADGVVTWTPNNPDESSPLGLFVANSNNGQLADPSAQYCLYETKVPAGFSSFGVQAVSIKAGATNATELNGTATQKGGPGLPLTGAQGQRNMMVIGIVLVAIAAVAMVVTRRRRQNR